MNLPIDWDYLQVYLGRQDKFSPTYFSQFLQDPKPDVAVCATEVCWIEMGEE